MKTPLLAALLALTPGAWASEKAALLWLPPEGTPFWEPLARVLARSSSLKLTIAVAPESLTSAGEQALTPWMEKGQLELALRIPGDPILPLIASLPAAPRPSDPPSRIAASKESARLVLGSSPSGFVPGAGAVSPELFEGFGSLGLSWVATGDYTAGTEAWAASGTVVLVPFKTVGGPDREISPDDLAPSGLSPSAYVMDESGKALPAGAAVRFLERAAEGEPSRRWVTVREAVEERGSRLSEASLIPDWPTWKGGFDLWNSTGSQPAWSLYAETALAIDRYQNSGSASLSDLERASDALYAAQAEAFYRDPAALSPADARRGERRLRNQLIAVYRRMRQAPPEDLLPAGSPLPGEAEPGEETAKERATGVHYSQGGSWASFENPAGSLAKREGLPPDEAAGFRLKSLRLDWDEEKILLTMRVVPPAPGKAGPLETGDMRLEAYIDLNGVLGAGSTSLLEGGSGFIKARDGWEYAVSAAGAEARLMRSSPQGPPDLVAKLPAQTDAKAGEVRVAVPRKLLKGNPLRWGFSVLALPAQAGSTPASILASLEDQRAFFKGGSAQGRVAAVRAPKAFN